MLFAVAAVATFTTLVISAVMSAVVMVVEVGGGIAFGALWTEYECQITNIFSIAFTAGLMSKDGFLTYRVLCKILMAFYRYRLFIC